MLRFTTDIEVVHYVKKSNADSFQNVQSLKRLYRFPLAFVLDISLALLLPLEFVLLLCLITLV